MVVITGVALLAITAGPLTPVVAIATETGVAATTCGAGTAAASTAAGTAAVTGSSGTAVADGTTLAASNPVGWAVLGKKDGTTYDCWKAVIHDQSTEPSNGMLLRDVMNHPNVSKVSMTTGSRPELPHIVIENIWKEEFEIEYFWLLPTVYTTVLQ